MLKTFSARLQDLIRFRFCLWLMKRAVWSATTQVSNILRRGCMMSSENLKTIVKSNGFTVMEIMVAVGLSAMVALGALSIVRMQSRATAAADTMAWVENVRSEIIGN